MPLPFIRRPLKKRMRWVLASVAMLLVLLAVPFIFTASLVRWMLAHSAYGRFSPTLLAAKLRPSGGLEVNGLALHEPLSGRELMWLGEVKVRFGWRELWGGKLRSIEINGAKIHVRASEAGGADAPAVSLLQLVSSEPVTGKPSASSGAPVWYDMLDVAGTLEVEPLPWAPAIPASLPLEIHSRSLVNRAAPWRDFSVFIHGQSPRQVLAFGCTTRPDGDRTIIDLHEFSITGVDSSFPLPTMLAESVGSHADISLHRLALQGTLTFDPAIAPRADFTLKIDDLSATSQPANGKRLSVEHLNLGAHAVASLTHAWSQDAALSEASLSFDTLSAGNSSITSATTRLALAQGTLAMEGLRFTLVGGMFTGDVHYDLLHQRLGSAALKVERLDQKELAAHLAPDKLDAEGTTSGTIQLAANAQGTWTGDIELTADGPGKLKIKDQAAAEALAGKLQTGEAAGVLPANFSTIVVQQLKDYPYATGHLRVVAPDGIPAVTLNYTRKPIGPGDPGYGVQTTIAGQPVLANYTIQLPALTVVLQGKTIAELVALAAGFEKQVAGAPDGNPDGNPNGKPDGK